MECNENKTKSKKNFKFSLRKKSGNIPGGTIGGGAFDDVEPAPLTAGDEPAACWGKNLV